jgi:hypothetical protein
MFGRREELRTYTEDDLVKAALRFLHDGEKPPQALGTTSEVMFVAASREDIEIHNENVRLLQSEVIYEAPRKPMRKSLAAAAVSIFTSIRP